MIHCWRMIPLEKDLKSKMGGYLIYSLWILPISLGPVSLIWKLIDLSREKISLGRQVLRKNSLQFSIRHALNQT